MSRALLSFGTLAAIALAGLLSSCSLLEEVLPPEADQAEAEQSPLKYLSKRNLKPMPVKPFTANSQCSHRDEAGTETKLQLKVKDSKVSAFSAHITLPQGECQFDLKDFRQTATLPEIELTHRSHSRCAVRMWAQDQQITVAYTDCPQACTGDSFDYLWPTLVNSRTGRCD